MNELSFNFSMQSKLIIILISFLTMMGYLIVSHLESKKIKNLDDYFIGGGNISLGKLSSTYLGSNITFVNIFIVLATYGYIYGLKTFWIPIWWIAGMLFFYKIFPKFSSFFATGQTLHEFLGEKFNSQKLRYVASLATVFVFIGTLGLEIFGVTYLIHKLGFNTRPMTMMIAVIFAIILISYATKGGFKAVVKTDIIQIILISVAIGILIYATSLYYSSHQIVINNNISQGLLKSNFFSDWIWIISMFIIFFPFQISVMDMWQRLAAVNGSIKMVKKMVVFDSIGFLVAYSLPIFMGIIVSLTNDNIANINDVFFIPIIQTLNPFLVAFLYAGLIAAIFSTADTLLVCSSHSFFRDFWGRKRNINEKDMDKQQLYLFTTRIIGYFIGMLSVLLIIALNFFELNEIVIAVFSGQIVFFIPLVTAIFKPNFASKKAKGAIISIILGLSIPFIVVIIGKLLNDRTLIDAAPIIGFIVALFAFFITPKQKIN